MSEQTRILILEDSSADAELAERALRRGKVDCIVRRAETRAEFLAALNDFRPDVILADYSLPAFNGLEALALTAEVAPTTPVLIVTGSLNEETAAACIKAGAVDYVLKERLARLPSAVTSALERRRVLEDKSKAEEAFRAGERRYRALFTESRDGMFVVDAATGQLLDANAAMLAMSGYQLGQLSGVRLQDFIAPEDAAAAQQALAANVRGSSLGALELDIVRADGSRLPVEIRASAYTDADGSVRLIGVVRDISDRRQRDLELRASEQRHRALFDEAQDAIFLADPATGLILDANRSGREMTGRDLDELRRMHQAELHPPEESDTARAAFVTYALGPRRGGVLLHVVRRDGHRTPVEISASTMTDEKGRMVVIGVFRDITERRAADAAARESAERFRLVVEGAPEALFTYADGKLTYLNPAALQLFGATSAEELLGKSPFERVAPAYRAIVVERARAIMEAHRPAPPLEQVFLRLDGTPFHVEVASVPFPHGDHLGVLVFFHDITDRATAERALRESEARFRALVDGAPSAVLLSRDGITLYLNRRFAELVGAPDPEATVGRPVLDFFAPQHRAESAERSRRRTLGLPVADTFESVFLRADGIEVPVHVSVAKVQLLDGPANLAFVRDITDRATAERALRESEERFRQVVEDGPEALFTAEDMKFTYVNPAALRLFGNATADEMLGRSVVERIGPEFHPLVRERLQRLVTSRVPTPPAELAFLRPDGTRFDVEVNSVPFPQGDRPGVLVFFRDVTERKRTVAELALLSTALSEAGEVAIITDTAGTIEYVNPAFERVTGYTRAEAIGQNPRLLKSGVHGPEVYRHMWDTLTSGGVFTGTLINRRKNGDHYVAVVIVSPVRDDAGKVARYVGLQRDVTHEHDLEEQLRQSQKMEAVGQLTGGIAHDFNNLLGVILANTSLLGAVLKGENAELGSYLTDIEHAAEAGSTMVKKLLAFGRRERLAALPIDLGHALREIERTLRRFLPESIAIRVDAPAVGPGALADPGALEQMVLNLATNARDALPGGGRLTLAVTEVEFQAEDAQVLQGLDRPGRYACLTVADSGTGMDAATLERVFEPFFTTKPPGAGTGLGLPMVFGLMQQHGGFVRVYSEPGQGTTVRLYFPSAETTIVTHKAPAATRQQGGTETILVVEDQEMLRRAAARALSKLGYRILVASDGEEGSRMFAEHPEQIDLVLSDRVMPELGGVELYQRLRAEGHMVPFLLMSGYAADAGGISPVPKDLRVIEKPWTVEKLAGQIRELLDAPPPA